MNKHIQKALLGTSAAAIALATSCGDDEVADKLVGEWDLDIQSSNARLFGQEPTFEYIYTWNFKSDGTFGECYEYLYNGVSQYKGCYQVGDWNWVKKNQVAEWNFPNSGKRFEGSSLEKLTVRFTEFDGDSFEATLEADYDNDGEVDASATATGTRVGDEQEWSEL